MSATAGAGWVLLIWKMIRDADSPILCCPPSPTRSGPLSGFRVGVDQRRCHPPQLASPPRAWHRKQAAVPTLGGRHLHHAAGIPASEGLDSISVSFLIQPFLLVQCNFHQHP